MKADQSYLNTVRSNEDYLNEITTSPQSDKSTSTQSYQMDDGGSVSDDGYSDVQSSSGAGESGHGDSHSGGSGNPHSGGGGGSSSDHSGSGDNPAPSTHTHTTVPDHTPTISADTMKIITWAVIGVIVAVIVWRLVKWLENYYFKKRVAKVEDMGEDTIYGHEFEKEIDEAHRHIDYDKMVILMYLKWLDTLDTQGVIKFHKAKTPLMFIDEVEAYKGSDEHPLSDDEHKNMLDKTRTLTKHYLRTRYGHKPVSEALAMQLKQL